MAKFKVRSLDGDSRLADGTHLRGIGFSTTNAVISSLATVVPTIQTLTPTVLLPVRLPNLVRIVG